jgi:hypothetical protein
MCYKFPAIFFILGEIDQEVRQVCCCLHISNKNESQKGAAKMPSCLKGHSQQITNAIKQEDKVSEHRRERKCWRRRGGGGTERVKSARSERNGNAATKGEIYSRSVHRVHTEWQRPLSGAFTLFTITYKVAVYAPAERAEFQIHSPISSLPLCALWVRLSVHVRGSCTYELYLYLTPPLLQFRIKRIKIGYTL